MKILFAAAIPIMLLASVAEADRPIFLTEAEACAKAGLVVIAVVGPSLEIPSDEPFGGFKWDQYGFTRSAPAVIEKILLRTPPEKLEVFGGKVGTGTDYRLEEGRFLQLLQKVEDNAFRAVDSQHSFMPCKDGKVEWLLETYPRKTELIPVGEALRRIQAHRVRKE